MESLWTFGGEQVVVGTLLSISGALGSSISPCTVVLACHTTAAGCVLNSKIMRADGDNGAIETRGNDDFLDKRPLHPYPGIYQGQSKV